MTTGLSFSQPRSPARIGLTSLIDVIFMLLMFFMLATSFEQWRSIQLTTGAEDSLVAKKPAESVLLRVHPDFIELNEKRVEISNIGSVLERMNANRNEVIVKPTGEVRLQRVINVMDQLRAAGIDNPVLQID